MIIIITRTITITVTIQLVSTNHIASNANHINNATNDNSHPA